jgi:uncharacterized protein YqfA (UPF0365 family)
MESWIFIAIAVFFIFGAIYAFIAIRFFRLWLQCYMSQIPVRLLDLVGMQFRRTNIRAVVQTMIMAKRSGITLTCDEVEKAYQQGTDLAKISLALVQAQKQGLDLTFEQLVDADLQGKLEEKLKAF